MIRRTVAAIAVSLTLAACGTPASAPVGSGVLGIVEVGPTCPVERINSPCPSHPLATTVVFRNGQGLEIARVQSGSNGRFNVDLRPGTYTVVGLDLGNSFLPRPIPTTVAVAEGRYSTVTVEYDNGIR